MVANAASNRDKADRSAYGTIRRQKSGDTKFRERKGGRANSASAKKALPADPMTTEELHAWLGVVFKGVIAGKIEPGVATASATVARTMAELLRATELEERITNLEAERDRRRLG